jgi:hypothetical protein
MALRIKDTPELPPINLEKLALQVVKIGRAHV